MSAPPRRARNICTHTTPPGTRCAVQTTRSCARCGRRADTSGTTRTSARMASIASRRRRPDRRHCRPMPPSQLTKRLRMLSRPCCWRRFAGPRPSLLKRSMVRTQTLLQLSPPLLLLRPTSMPSMLPQQQQQHLTPRLPPPPDQPPNQPLPSGRPSACPCAADRSNSVAAACGSSDTTTSC